MINDELVNKLNSIDAESLKRKDLGPLNFEEVDSTLKLFLEFLNFFIKNLSIFRQIFSQRESELESFLQNFLNFSNQISSFDVNSGDPAGQRRNLISQINSQWQNFFNSFNSHYFFILIQEGSFNKIREELNNTDQSFKKIYQEAKNTNEEVAKILNEAKTQGEETKNKINEIIEEARKFSTKDVVVKYSEIFGEQAQYHQEKTTFWWKCLAGSIVGEIVLAVILIVIYYHYFNNVGTTLSVSVAITKLFILSAGFLFIAQCVKNLNAHNHLAVINKHRANALASFKAFINSTDDPQIKDALIIQVAQSIFDPSISGYLSKEEAPNLTNIDIIKKIIDGK